MVEASFARLRASVATSSEERAPSHPFCRLGLVAIVETQGNSEKVVRRASREAYGILCTNEDERPSCHQLAGVNMEEDCVRGVDDDRLIINQAACC